MPETVFIMFQLTFVAIIPALIVGAFTERVRFGPLLAFTALRVTFSYLPIAHMAWAGVGGVGLTEGVSMDAQVGKQAMAVLVTCTWSGAVIFIA